MKRRSVLRDHRATPTVVDADGDEIDVLANTFVREDRSGRNGNASVHQSNVPVVHEHVIVFDRGRPVRGEAVFEAAASHATPAGVVVAGCNEVAGRGEERAMAVGSHRGAALYVKQSVVPGVADLAGEQSESVDFGLVREESHGGQEAAVDALEVSPVALRFEADHEGAGLPAIADLTTGGATGRIMATFSADECAGRGYAVPAIARQPPAAVGADVEAAPVIDRSDHRGRLGVGAGGKISGRCRRAQAQRNQTNSTKQKCLHGMIPVLIRVRWSPKRLNERRERPSDPNSTGQCIRFSDDCRLRNAPLESQVHPREVHDLLGISGNARNPAGGQTPPPERPNPRSALINGTKLEHLLRECYMWITGDRRARGISERIGSVPGWSQGECRGSSRRLSLRRCSEIR